MKKNILLSALIIVVIISCTVFISDGPTYLAVSLMALAIMGTIRLNRSRVMKITRWGKANPGKAQVLITFLQIALMMLGMIAGYNFYKLGYEFSDTTAFVFGTIMVACFLSVHFLPKRGTIAIPAEVNKHRVIFMGIALSSFVLMVITGNRVEDKYPNSFVAHSLKAIDHAIFHDNNMQYADLNDVTSGEVNSEGANQVLAVNSSAIVLAPAENETLEPNNFSNKENREKFKALKKVKKLEKRKARMMKRLETLRKAFAGGMTAGAVLLMILLICTLCAGVCLIIAGFSGSAGLIPLGAVIAGGSIWGIIKISQGNRGKKLP
jgi:hypothetical protein